MFDLKKLRDVVESQSLILSLTKIGRLSLRSMTDISISSSSVPSCNVDQTKKNQIPPKIFKNFRKKNNFFIW